MKNRLNQDVMVRTCLAESRTETSQKVSLDKNAAETQMAGLLGKPTDKQGLSLRF